MRTLLIVLALVALGSGPVRAQKKPAGAAKKTTKAAAPAGAATASLLAGKSIYTQYCLSCHQADGGGVDGMNPPLSKTTYVLGDKTRLVKVLLNGLQGQDINGERYANVMASQDFLSDQQIADVLTYVRNNFGNKASAVKAAEVKAIRAANR
ncbi:MAG: hypothetical protein NVS3B25_11540 [Hymenobacter sp.]